MDQVIDDRDARLLEILQKQGRLPVREIAGKAGLRPSTCHQRIQRLVKNGVIERFTVKLNDSKVGQGFTAFMLISSRKVIPARFFEQPQVKECYGITGEYDLLLKLKFGDVSGFNEFLISMRKNKGIVKTLTMVSTIKIKD